MHGGTVLLQRLYVFHISKYKNQDTTLIDLTFRNFSQDHNLQAGFVSSYFDILSGLFNSERRNDDV